MLEKIGNGKYVLPPVIALLVGCVFSLMFYPLMNAAPKELPFAVVGPGQGPGDQVVQKIIEAPHDTIAWLEYSSQAEVDEAFANNELFGALTIPADFGQTQPPTVSVVLDNAKSPMVAGQMQPALSAMFGQMGFSPELSIRNTGDAESGTASPMSGMMSQQLAVLPLIIMSLLGSILIIRIFPKHASGSSAILTLGKQLGYALGFSLFAAITVVTMLNVLVGANAPLGTTISFLWFASFAVMALLLGSFNIAFPLGVVVALCIVVLGSMTAALPAEMLPSLWADWIYPWAPQHFMGDGIRDILYRGADLMPQGSTGLLAVGSLGLGLIFVAGLLPSKRT